MSRCVRRLLKQLCYKTRLSTSTPRQLRPHNTKCASPTVFDQPCDVLSQPFNSYSEMDPRYNITYLIIAPSSIPPSPILCHDASLCRAMTKREIVLPHVVTWHHSILTFLLRSPHTIVKQDKMCQWSTLFQNGPTLAHYLPHHCTVQLSSFSNLFCVMMHPSAEEQQQNVK